MVQLVTFKLVGNGYIFSQPKPWTSPNPVKGCFNVKSSGMKVPRSVPHGIW